MMPDFNSHQLSFFDASYGAGSLVTKTEHGDSQVTFDKLEKAVLHQKIPSKKIPRGGVKSKNAKKFSFRIFKSKKNANLYVNLPKKAGNETRLYLSANAGFKPEIGDYWFIFQDADNGDLVIGTMDKETWLATRKFKDREDTTRKSLPALFDREDDVFQNAIHNPNPKSGKIVTYKREDRNRTVALKALRSAKFRCEIDEKHDTFLDMSGRNFVEAHHLVPLAATKELDLNLDFEGNIVSLCPNCHRAIHYANLDKRLNLIEELYLARQKKIKRKGVTLTLADLASLYGII